MMKQASLRFLSILALVLLVFAPVSAQERRDGFLSYLERADIGSGPSPEIVAIAALVAHARETGPDDAVTHMLGTARMNARISRFGALDTGLIASGEADVALRYRPGRTIEWLLPQPAPSYVDDLNGTLSGRRPTNLRRPASWSIVSPLAALGTRLPLHFEVEPFEAAGGSYALVRFDLAETSFQVQGASGRLKSKGAFVLSADFSDIAYYISQSEGQVTFDGRTQPFRFARGLVGLHDDGARPILPVTEIPAGFDSQGIVALDPAGIQVTRPAAPAPPDPAYGIVSAIMNAVEAQIGIEAENRGNPVFLVVVAAISTFNTADGIITSAVNLTGRVTGNDRMTNFEGIGNTAFRTVGTLAGKTARLVFKNVDPKKWGDVTVKTWEFAGLASDTIMFVTPGGALGALSRGDRTLVLLEKAIKVLQKDRVKIVAASLEILNSCSGTFFDEKDQLEKVQDCVSGVGTVALKKYAHLNLPDPGRVIDQIDLSFKTLDFLYSPQHENTIPRPVEGPAAVLATSAPAGQAQKENAPARPDKPKPRAQKLAWPSD